MQPEWIILIDHKFCELEFLKQFKSKVETFVYLDILYQETINKIRCCMSIRLRIIFLYVYPRFGMYVEYLHMFLK